MEERTDYLDFIKISNFCSVKDIVKRMKKQAIDLNKVLAKDISDKGWLLKYTKNFKNNS